MVPSVTIFTMVSIVYFIRIIHGALNIYENLMEDFISRIYDHIYIDCGLAESKYYLTTTCSSLLGDTCEALVKNEKTSLPNKMRQHLFHTTHILEEDFGATDFNEQFSLILIQGIQWLLNSISIFPEPDLSHKYFKPIDPRNISRNIFQNQTIATKIANITISKYPLSFNWFKWVSRSIRKVFHSNMNVIPLDMFHLLNSRPVKLNNKYKLFINHSQSRSRTTSREDVFSQYEFRVHTLKIVAPSFPFKALPEFYGSNISTLSVRWIGEWKVLPDVRQISKSHTMHRDHSNNHSTLQNINHCMELIGTQHAILFSTPVVVVTMDSTIMMQPLLDSLNQKTLLFIQGIIFHSKPTNNKWIYNLSPLVDLKNFAFQRVWTARIEPLPSHPIADLNVSDYIIAGFPYSRVDGIVFSFAQSDIIAMSHRTKTYHEYLVMNQRANEGIRFCLNSIRIRFFLDSSHGALDRKNQTRGNNAIRNTKTGLVLIPVVQQETTQTPLAFHSVLNHLPVHSSQSMDYVDWLTYWSHYLKSQIEKRNSEKTSLENIPFMTLQDVIRFQLYNALVPFLEMTSDRVVLNKDSKRFMKRVHFWKVTNIPKEAPLCTLTELRRNFLALPLRPTSRTLVTDHFFN